MGRRLGTAALVMWVMATGLSVMAEDALRSVRPEGSAVRALIDDGISRSATLRDLVHELDNSDVVVYIRFAPCTGGVPACLLWAAREPRTRRLLIKINRFGGSPKTLMALLAHELQHAFEVASTPEINDAQSLEHWFEAHGWRASEGFETNEAAAVTRTVMAELRGAAISTRLR